MNQHITAPIHVFLMVAAVLLFGFATFSWPASFDPYRQKLIAGGLFCWALSEFFIN